MDTNGSNEVSDHREEATTHTNELESTACAAPKHLLTIVPPRPPPLVKVAPPNGPTNEGASVQAPVEQTKDKEGSASFFVFRKA